MFAAILLASLLTLADAYFRADVAAMEQQRSAVASSGNHYQAALAEWLYSQTVGGDSQRSVAALRRADEHLNAADPNDAHAHFLRTRVLYLLMTQSAIDGKEAFRRMQESYNAAKKLAPDDPLTIMLDGLVQYYSPKGDRAAGRALMRKSIDLLATSKDPEAALWHPIAWNWYGSTFLGEGMYDEARDAFQTGLRIRPDYVFLKNALMPMTDVVDAGAAPKKSNGWKALVADAAGDGRMPGLADLRNVSWRRDGQRVWFRFELAGEPDPEHLGVNIALDVDGDPANGSHWWAGNTAFRYDRLVTVWVGKGKDGRYRGTLGVADSPDVMAGRYVGSKDVRFALEPRAIVVGVDRKVLGRSPRLVATVGSNVNWNDVAPMEGAATLQP